MGVNPHQVTKDFERGLCIYTGAPYAVAVNSCTMALLLAVRWHLRHPLYIDDHPEKTDEQREEHIDENGIRWSASLGRRMWAEIQIPKRTYVGVPMSIIHAGGRPTFRDECWIGAYQLKPLPVWDSARYFTSGLYRGEMAQSSSALRMDRDCAGQMVCVSFHWSKTLGIQQGGAILHDDQEADAWLRRARFDGRAEGVAPKDDTFPQIGWHCYMSPEVAAEGLMRLSFLPPHNAPLPNDEYPDLSQLEIFR